MIIAEIIKWYQPEIYGILQARANEEFVIGVGYIPPEEDELPEFKRIKYLMEERRGVVL